MEKKNKKQTDLFSKINNIHTYGMDIILTYQRQAITTLMANYIKSKYQSVKTIYSPVDIMRDMKKEYDININ